MRLPTISARTQYPLKSEEPKGSMQRSHGFMTQVAAVAIVLLAAACGSDPSLQAADEKPDTVAVAHWWDYHFTNLEEMVATSDLVVVGEVTAIERGPMPTDDPDGIGLRNVTVTISETLKGTAAGTTVVIGEAGYYNDGSTDVSYELADMPWSQLGDIGVFSLKHYDGQPANHFTHVHPDGRMLTHYRDEGGQSQMYDGTVETFSHTALGATLTELAPDRAAEHVRQAALAVVTEEIEPQRPFYESIFEIESDDTSPGGINNTGSGTDSSVPVGPGEPGTTSEHAFCEQAEFFASRSVRDNDNHTSEIQSQSGTASLDALTKLRDLAPASLRADLDLLVAYEQSYDPANEEQPTSVEVSRAGERVGSAIEQRCDLQLPYVRSDS